MAQKGTVGVGIDVGEGNTVMVFTTHTQADPGTDPFWWPVTDGATKSVTARKTQMGVVVDFVREKIEEERMFSNVAGCIVTGDLNFSSHRVQRWNKDRSECELAETAEYVSIIGMFGEKG